MGSLRRLQSSQLGLQESEGTIESGGYISEKACSYGWQVLAGYWLETPDACHLGLSIGLLECPHNTAAGFAKASNSRGSKVEASLSFMTHFCQPYSVWEKTTQENEC